MGYQNDYERVAQNIVARYMGCFGLSDEQQIDWASLVDWMEEDIRPHVCASTYIKYRAAIIYKTKNPILRVLFTKKTTPKAELKVLKTSRKRMKRLPQSDMDALCHYAQKSKSKWANIATQWLMAGCYTGLRPKEWLGAHITEDEQYLVVDNKKLEQCVPDFGQSERLIPLVHLNREEKDAVINTLHSVQDFGLDAYDFLVRQVQSYLKRANLKCFPRRKKYICLLSGRHQFQANLKASKLTPKEIAYLVGHAVDDRSYESYGSKRYGNPVNISAEHAPSDALNKIKEKIEDKWAAKHERNVRHQYSQKVNTP